MYATDTRSSDVRRQTASSLNSHASGHGLEFYSKRDCNFSEEMPLHSDFSHFWPVLYIIFLPFKLRGKGFIHTTDHHLYT